MTKGKLIAAGFFVFCLAATFFIVTTPSGSQNNTQQPYEYDPWVDVNDDGVIACMHAFLTITHSTPLSQ